MTFTNPIRSARAWAALAVAFVLPGQALAQVPSQLELARISPSGSYLAARHASTERDSAAAFAFYRSALRHDPRNPELLERAFLSAVADGEIEEGVKLAERLVAIDKNNRTARLVLGVRALKQKQYQVARTQLTQSVRGPITDLTATLLTAWAQLGANEAKKAVETIDKLSGPDWYAVFKELHAGMILDRAGQKKEAAKRLEQAHKLDANALRVVEAQASLVSRTRAKAEALAIYETFEKTVPRHPLVTEAMKKLRRGEALPFIADSPQTGAAEALYGLGASLGRRGGADLALVYLQLALYLAPDHSLALLSLGDLYEAMKKPQLSVKAYERVPERSPLKRNAEIQLATDLDALERTDEAKKRLEKLIADQPQEIDAMLALGNILRTRKDFATCAEVYDKGVATLAKPERSHWTIFYFRGICYERSKQWPKSEADLKKALELFPDQPHVLNYLGYSWVDQGMNLDEGMRMIKRAVEQRPDDGYIVDSLGWAYYRIGNYEEAVKHLERAVELRPEDPTINDHLGDGYWRIGRTLEARFQWTHARDLKPEPEELAKIERKLRDGLVDETPSAAADAKPKKPGEGG